MKKDNVDKSVIAVCRDTDHLTPAILCGYVYLEIFSTSDISNFLFTCNGLIILFAEFVKFECLRNHFFFTFCRILKSGCAFYCFDEHGIEGTAERLHKMNVRFLLIQANYTQVKLLLI